MNNTIKSTIIALLLLLMPLLLLCGCSEDKSGGTISEPEITGDYLSGEYAEQLITDGADTVLGYVTMTKNDDSLYSVEVIEKEIVPNTNYDEGYYIADTNRVVDATFGSSARIACLDNGKLVVKTADEFIEAQKNASSDEMHIYTVYMMGDSVELIVENVPEDVVVK